MTIFGDKWNWSDFWQKYCDLLLQQTFFQYIFGVMKQIFNTILRSGLNNNLVGIFYSYQTIWIALVRPPSGGYCYLNHACIVIYLCPHWLSKLKGLRKIIGVTVFDLTNWFFIRNILTIIKFRTEYPYKRLYLKNYMKVQLNIFWVVIIYVK